MKEGGVYGFKNVINGKWYIGQTIDLKKRRRKHFWELRNGRHGNSHLQRSFTKHGEDAFVFYILERCADDELDEKERFWIGFHETTNDSFGYNSESGGHANKRVSEQTRQRMSAASTGRRHSEETRRRISVALTGRTGPSPSQETRAKLSVAGKGRVASSETKARLSLARKGKPLSIGHRVKLSIAHMGQRSWNKGKQFSDETRRKLSLSHKGKCLSGETKQKLSLGHKKNPKVIAHIAELARSAKGQRYSEDRVKKAADGLRAYYASHPNPQRTHCTVGHLLTEENTYRNSDGNRECRICRRQRKRAWVSRRKEQRQQPHQLSLL